MTRSRPPRDVVIVVCSDPAHSDLEHPAFRISRLCRGVTSDGKRALWAEGHHDPLKAWAREDGGRTLRFECRAMGGPEGQRRRCGRRADQHEDKLTSIIARRATWEGGGPVVLDICDFPWT